MPIRQLVLIALLVAATPIPAVAQADTAATALPVVCPDSLSAGGLKVCQAALDGATMLHPFAALLMNGGNPRLGSAAPIGKFGHFAVTLRATTATGVIPDLTYDGSTDTVAVGQRVQFYAPHVDLALGLVQMVMPMGTIGVDAMFSALVIPSDRTTAFTPVPGSRTIGKAAVTLDWGVRFGMTSPTLPTVSLTIMKRSTPTVQLGGTTDGNTTAYTFNASSIDVRLFAGKRFDWLDLAAGAGVDLLSGTGEVAYRDPGTDVVGAPLEPKLSGMRIVTALNLGVHLGPLEFVAEGGYQVGSNLALTTRFAEVNPNTGKFFGGFGVVLSRE
ncbi:MAG TPA: hypothetical protein VFN22_06435 [Gemmatimonadales bacterium]|nr:hypothetical protein [Gemmatimonadales bacterium]